MPASVASVIVTTYNRPAALRMALAGLLAQSRDDFEVLVADDGSGAPTRHLLEDFFPRFSGRLRHVWQEDLGFRVSAARNRALEIARGDLAIFLDGDCIPGPDFVEGHRRETRRDRIVRGARVLLSEALTHACEADPEAQPHLWSTGQLHELAREGAINRSNPLRGGLYDRLRMLTSSLRRHNWRLLRGCNFSVPMQAIHAVRGFDEKFVGWGYEDSDLCIRLMNHGLYLLRGPADICVLHLWHPERNRCFEGENLRRLEETRMSYRLLPSTGMRLRSDPS